MNINEQAVMDSVRSFLETVRPTSLEINQPAEDITQPDDHYPVRRPGPTATLTIKGWVKDRT